MGNVGLVVAYAEQKDGNPIIGCDGIIPWHCSEEMKLFKEITRQNEQNILIMGRKTYESIPDPHGKGRHKLPGRTIVILTRTPQNKVLCGLNKPYEINMTNLISHIIKAKKDPDVDVWFAGGQQIYDSAIYNRIIDVAFCTKMLIDLDLGDCPNKTLFPLAEFNHIVMTDLKKWSNEVYKDSPEFQTTRYWRTNENRK